jgi:putative restriction endonuclease
MIEYYSRKLAQLNTDKSKSRWDKRTMFRAPHKPILLLAVLDRFSEDTYHANLIELDNELLDLFAIYWALIDPPSIRGNIAMPFYHLQSDKFWHLLPRQGFEERLKFSGKIHSISRLHTMIIGARLDDDLYILMSNKETRDTLRTVLIDSYFAHELRPRLIEQGIINLESYLYSKDLLEKVKGSHIREFSEFDSPYEEAIRDQGFRRAIVQIYQHRCALCGIRMLTPDGHTVVEAAHIIPWSVCHSDDPRNGMALCRLCHWTFDKGLIAVTQEYMVHTSPRLNSNNNLPAHLTTLAGRTILGPIDKDYWPDQDSLNWHLREKFRQR